MQRVKIIGLVKQFFLLRKSVIIFLHINLAYVVGAQKNRLIGTVLLSTHNMFWLRNKKNNFPLHTLIWRPVRSFLCMTHVDSGGVSTRNVCLAIQIFIAINEDFFLSF